MAKNNNLKDFLTDVADAIREKKGTTGLINPQDFSAEIASIQSGGGAVAASAKAVNFRDCDGTILHSYTKDEFLALTELPPLPTREGLICQEWNWDFADAVEYVSEYGVLEVGATYITDDGKTRLYITIAAEGRMDVPLYFNQSVANGVTIDWGDGATETLSGAGNVNTTHHYNAIGDYVITLDVADGCLLVLGYLNNTTYCVMGAASTAYCDMLKKVELGARVSLESVSFEGCSSLTLLTIPKDAYKISSKACYGCRSLVAIVLPKKVESINIQAFYACHTTKSISIPNGVTTIGSSGVSESYALGRLVLPTSLTSLSSSAIANFTALASLKIPKGITSIAATAFAGNTSMAFYDFSALNAIPSLANKNAFNSIPSDCKIIVPDALYDTWIAATNWSTYASKIIKKSEWDAQNA